MKHRSMQSFMNNILPKFIENLVKPLNCTNVACANVAALFWHEILVIVVVHTRDAQEMDF